MGDVLVDAKGLGALRVRAGSRGTIVCTGACVAFWSPLTVGAGRPSAGDALHGKLGVVSRPDGARQVTFRGRPLYRFTQDPSPGVVTGNGFADSFGGRSFTWHVVDAERRRPDERELERHGRIEPGLSTADRAQRPSRDPRGDGRRRLQGQEEARDGAVVRAPAGDEDAIA